MDPDSLDNGPAASLLGLWSDRTLMRTFRRDPLPEPVLETLEYAARLGARTGNAAHQHTVFVTDREVLEPLQETLCKGLNRVNFWVRTAPVIAVALARRTLVGTIRSIDPDRFDLVQGLERVALAAQVQGVGSCPVLGFDADGVQRVLMAPRQWRPVSALCLGYPGVSGQEIMGIAVIRDFNEYYHRFRERLDRRTEDASARMVSRNRFRGGRR